MNIEKIRKILEDKYERMKIELWDETKPELACIIPYKIDELWTEYMNSLDCTLITEEDIKEDLEGIINDSSRGRICIRIDHLLVEYYKDMLPTSRMNRQYVLMPQELADKVLVLGGLPDFAEA